MSGRKELRITSQFKKDLKKIKYDTKKISELKAVLDMLSLDGTVSARYKPHSLSGEYNDCMECHIGNDVLLIWKSAESNVIVLLRYGSHSELFK